MGNQDLQKKLDELEKQRQALETVQPLAMVAMAKRAAVLAAEITLELGRREVARHE